MSVIDKDVDVVVHWSSSGIGCCDRAAVVKTIREHDLAVLNIGAEKLPVAE